MLSSQETKFLVSLIARTNYMAPSIQSQIYNPYPVHRWGESIWGIALMYTEGFAGTYSTRKEAVWKQIAEIHPQGRLANEGNKSLGNVCRTISL